MLQEKGIYQLLHIGEFGQLNIFNLLNGNFLLYRIFPSKTIAIASCSSEFSLSVIYLLQSIEPVNS